MMRAARPITTFKRSSDRLSAGGVNRRMFAQLSDSNTSKIHTSAKPREGLQWPVVLFLVSLAIPWIFYIGPFRFSAYRLVLIVTIIPCIVQWLGGRAGRIRIADISLLVFCFWGFLSFLLINGMSSAMEPSGMLFLETMGAYFLARCSVRDANDFVVVVRLLFRIVLLLAPFAIIEAITGHNVLLQLASALGSTVPDYYMDPRWGLRRVQATFDHPILFGVSTGSIFALSHFVLGYGKSFPQRWIATGVTGMTAFLSLSAGAITGMMSQGLLIAWNYVLGSFEARWKILVGFGVLIVVAAELVANRSLPAIFIGYFAFDQESAWIRIAIWHYGSESVMNNPLLGVGLNEPVRPQGMTSSIDMFWIYHAIRHGLVAEFSLLLAYFSIFLAVAFKQGLDTKTSVFRTAFLITMVGYFVVGWTVHFWNATYVQFLFLLGAGVWILDVNQTQTSPVRTRRMVDQTRR